MKFLFYVPGVWFFWGRMVNLAHREYGISSDVITIGRRYRDDLIKFTTCKKTFDLAEDLAANLPSGAQAEKIVLEFEEKARDVRAALLLGMDRYLAKKPADLQWRIFAHHVRVAEDILDEGYDAGFVEFSDLFALILYYLGRHRGTRILSILHSSLPGFIHISEGPFGFNETVRRNWAQIKRDSPSSEELSAAESLVKDLLTRRYQLFDTGSRNRHALDAILLPLKSFADALYHAPQESRANYRHDTVLNMIRRRTIFPLRRATEKYLAGYELPVAGEKFAYYPLHYDPDLATLVYAPYYKGQSELIRNISYSLPADIRLYVKEHPVAIGTRSRGFYQAIRENGRVRLIDPNVNSLDLIPRAEMILTITGTVGWESILLQKPVIVFGDTFWNSFDLVRMVKDPQAISSTMDEVRAHWRPDWDLSRKFVLAYLRALKPGDLSTFPHFYWPEGEPKIKVILDSLLEYLGVRET